MATTMSDIVECSLQISTCENYGAESADYWELCVSSCRNYS